MFQPKHHPSSAVDSRGFRFHAQNGWGYFRFTCQDLNGAFQRALTIKVTLQYWAYTRALQREKSISPLFHGPIGTMVTNDWCISNALITSVKYLC